MKLQIRKRVKQMAGPQNLITPAFAGGDRSSHQGFKEPRLAPALPMGDAQTLVRMPAGQIHECYTREVLARAGRLPEAMLRQLVAFAVGLRSVWLNGAHVRRRTGKGLRFQLAEQFHLARNHGILPRWYYMFELFDDGRRRRAHEYLLRAETKRGIYGLCKTRPRSPITDKARFAEWCQAHGLATIPIVLALDRKGEVVLPASGLPVLPDWDLFIKPNPGKGGRHIERWDFVGDGRFRNIHDEVVSRAGLVARLGRAPFKNGCIVQPRVINHHALADLCNGALATVRILTCRNDRGEFEITNAVLRMPCGPNAVVDNLHAGGIAAKVDIRSGVLGRATDLGLRPGIGWVERHPVSGAQILGRKLPFWRETVELARRAHAAFGDRVIVGWDVAILAAGPCLVEGNSSPDLDIVQRTHQEPVGNARLGQLLALALAKRPDEAT